MSQPRLEAGDPKTGGFVHHGVVDQTTAFIEKPFTPDGLVAKVQSLLEGAGATG